MYVQRQVVRAVPGFQGTAEIAREVARLAPNATLIEEWRDAGVEKMQEAVVQLKNFYYWKVNGLD